MSKNHAVSVIPAVDGYFVLEPIPGTDSYEKFPIIAFLVGHAEYPIPISILGYADSYESILTPTGTVYDHNMKEWPNVVAWQTTLQRKLLHTGGGK